jgi:hypothetical protein
MTKLWTSPGEVRVTFAGDPGGAAGAFLRLNDHATLAIQRDPAKGLEVLHELAEAVARLTGYYNLLALSPDDREAAELLARKATVEETRDRLFPPSRPTPAETSTGYRDAMRDAGRGRMVP